MTVTLDLTRKAVSIAWDPGVNVDPVKITATNPATGDISTRDGLENDGLAVFTFPSDYHGTAHFTVVDADGELIDEGTVQV